MASERLQVILELVTGNYQANAAKAAASTQALGASAKIAGGQARNAAGQFVATGGAAQVAGTSVAGMSSRVSGLGAKLDKVAKGGLLPLAAGAFAAKQAFDVTVGAFASFDDAMTESLAIMGDVSVGMREDLSDTAREVAKTTIFSADQAAEAYFFLASAGFDAQQSIAAMPQVAKFAQAGMFDMALATDLATDAQSALGLKSADAAQNLENLTRVTDVFVKANILANTSVEQVASAMTNKAGAALRSLGKDIEEGAAVLAAFADQGVKGSEAGTQFSIVLRDLQTKALGNKAAFAEAGVAVFDAAGEMRNIADIIGDLEVALTGMSDAEKKSTLLNLGFADKSVAAITTLLGTSDAIRTYEAALRDAGGITEEVAEKQVQSATKQWELFKAELQDIGIEIGSKVVPALLDLLPALKDGAVVAGQFADALGPVLEIAGQFTSGRNDIIAWGQELERQGGVASGFGTAVERGLQSGLSNFTFLMRAADELWAVMDDGPATIDGMSTGLQNHGDALRRATSGYDQMGDSVGSADEAMLNMARRGAADLVTAMEHVPPAVRNTAGPLGGLIGDLLAAQAAAENLFGVLKSASDPVFAAVEGWQSYQEAIKTASEDGTVTAIEKLGLLKEEVDLSAALGELGSDYDDAMNALALATNEPIEKIEELFEALGLIDGKTFSYTVESQFRTSGTGPPPPINTGGPQVRAHGGPVDRHRLYRVGESDRPELYMIPGDGGRVFSNNDTQALIAAFRSGGGGGTGATFNIPLQSTGNPHVDAQRVGAVASVLRRMEGR